jgi:hypothetical protein
VWKGDAKYPAFLDDYSYLIQAYIHLQEVTGNAEYLLKAKTLTEKVMASFSDDEDVFFWFTDSAQTDVIVRKKEVYDGATPSGNAVMAFNLAYLSVVFDMPQWKERAETMMQSLRELIMRYPTSFGVWALSVQQQVAGLNEIAVVGPSAIELCSRVSRLFIPNKVIQSATSSQDEFPLLKGKWRPGMTDLIYLCRNYLCEEPVATPEKLTLLLKS